MKILPVGAELFRADGQTDGWRDMTKLTVNSANAPNKTRPTLNRSWTNLYVSI